MTSLTPSEAKSRVHGPDEVAFLDVREPGQFGEGHPLFAVNCPYSRLELAVTRLVPRSDVPVLLLDEDDGVAARAARRLEGLGYTDVALIEGGAAGWARAGYNLYKGVNVPSKTLGELVEAAWHPQVVDARTLAAWRAEGRDFALFDTRPPAEHHKMTLPGAVSAPNGELLHRFAAAVPEGVPVVLTCAGRTRGIIGAVGLQAAGIRQPVYALENGTQGWALAGFELERGRLPQALPELSAPLAQASRRRAEALARQAGIPFLDAAGFRRIAEDPGRTLFLLDVRTAEEFAAGHLAGATHAPGVQVVQATDQWVGVRRARIVLTDDTGLRAVLAGFWLKQLGFEVFVLRQEDAAGLREGARLCSRPGTGAIAPLPSVPAAEAARAVQEGRGRMIDLRLSLDYRRGHAAGAVWTTRPRAGRAVTGGSVFLMTDDPPAAGLAALDVREAGAADIRLVAGGFEAWQRAGLPVESTPEQPADHEAIDFLFFVHDRHDGNLDAARRYLAWETGLVDQLDPAERSEFRLIEPFALSEAP